MDELTPIEARVVADWTAGLPADLGPDLPQRVDATRRVRADVLRRAVLGLKQADGAAMVEMSSVSLAGAWIDGDLSLRDARGSGGAVAPALLLTRCVMPGVVDLSDGHFRRLSLAGCRLTRVICDDARFDGAVDISDVTSAEEEGACSGAPRNGTPLAAAVVSLRGASIDGDLRASRTRLCVTPKDEAVDYSGGGLPYALDLSSAEVAGSLVLQPEFEAQGGLKLSDATIKGSVWLQGATLHAEHADALSLSQTRVEGSVLLSALFRARVAPKPFEATGLIRLYGAEIDGELYLGGAKLRALPGELALLAYTATVGRHVRLDVGSDWKTKSPTIPFEAAGGLSFRNATLGGFSASGALIDGLGTASLEFASAHIRGDFTVSSAQGSEVSVDAEGASQQHWAVHRSVLRGPLNGSRLTVDGRFEVIGARLDAWRAPYALFLPEARIGGSMRLVSWQGLEGLVDGSDSRPVSLRTVVDEGSISIFGATVGGTVAILDVALGCRLHNLDQANALSAAGIKVSHAVLLSGLFATGAIDLSAAQIEEGLEVTKSTFNDRVSGGGLYLPHASVGGTLKIEALRGRGYVHLKHCTVHADLIVSDVTLWGSEGSISASNARVHGAVTLNCQASGLISFDHVHVTGQVEISEVTMAGTAHAVPDLSFENAQFDAGLVLTPKGHSRTATAIRATSQFTSERFLRFRATPMSCYPGWRLVEALVADGDDYGVLAMLWDGHERTVTLSGLSPAVHAFNQLQRPHLSAETAADYLSFFCHHVWGSDGPFRIIRSSTALQALNVDPAPYTQILTVPPQRVRRGWKRRWTQEAFVLYGNSLFLAKFEISPSGTVVMNDDRTIQEPVTPPHATLPRFARPLRRAPRRIDPVADELARPLKSERSWPDIRWFPGVWNDLSNEEAAEVLAALRERPALIGASFPSGFHVRRVRSRALPCFPDWSLLQGLADGPDGECVFAWLYRAESGSLLLDGRGTRLREFVREYPPSLSSIDALETYARFVLAHIWENGSPYLVAGSVEELPFNDESRALLKSMFQPLRIDRRERTVEVRGITAHGSEVFHGSFVVHFSGRVEMTAREVAQQPPGLSSTFTFHDWAARPVPGSKHPEPETQAALAWPIDPLVDTIWSDVDDAETLTLKSAYDREQHQLRVRVSLKGTSARMVEDRFGTAWGDQVQLGLAGFVYDQIDQTTPEESWKFGHDFGSPAQSTTPARPWRGRLVWLRRQFEGRPLRAGRDFDRQPHTQLARVYRNAGRTEDARGIVRDALNLEGRLDAIDFARRWWTWLLALNVGLAVLLLLMGIPLVWASTVGVLSLLGSSLGPLALHYAFRVFFGFGLYTHRAVLTLIGFLFVGWLGTLAANRGTITFPSLEFGPISVPSVKIADFTDRPQALFIDLAPVNTVVVEESPQRTLVPGAEMAGPGVRVTTAIPCGDSVDAFLYAADVFIPLIDLKQESMCSPGPVTGWRWAKAVYAFLGWVVTSLTILTVSGVLRQRSEE